MSLPPIGVIVEGVECAGKTTLIKRLRDEVVPWDCKYLGHQPGHQFERYMRDYLLGGQIIFNRAHFSEIVYSSVFGRTRPFLPHEQRVLDEYAERHFVIVLCDADPEILARRYAERSYFQVASLDKLGAIRDGFREVCGHLGRCVHYTSNTEAALEGVLFTIKASIGLESGGA